ncbi:hypothetical protein ZEAMMB73_Zm00001d036589 [Zea mays]|uniref:Uncharacterized protein n=1 Tax=Zea mays TaxID=4577 RepID=A0A1D6LPM6_MAIZE|nr:hypothetical protein ZEAMMB73_Zm00001d036589 [Zea mays]
MKLLYNNYRFNNYKAAKCWQRYSSSSKEKVREAKVPSLESFAICRHGLVSSVGWWSTCMLAIATQKLAREQKPQQQPCCGAAPPLLAQNVALAAGEGDTGEPCASHPRCLCLACSRRVGHRIIPVLERCLRLLSPCSRSCKKLPAGAGPLAELRIQSGASSVDEELREAHACAWSQSSSTFDWDP